MYTVNFSSVCFFPEGLEDPIKGELPANKLKAIMSVVRDLHMGGCRAITCASNFPEVRRFIFNMLEELSKVSAWIHESKRSACRQGAMRALALCKVYNPFFELAQLLEGVPSRRADGRLFEKEDYQQAVRESRVEDSIIADDINVERFEPGYDEQGRKRLMPNPEPIDLKPLGFRMPMVNLSTPSVTPAPKSGVGKPDQVEESTPGK